MIACSHQSAKKHGRDKFGRQRFRCLACGATFTGPKPLGDSRLPESRAVMCLKMLLEGMSIRATSRLTQTDKNAIIDLVVTVAPAASGSSRAGFTASLSMRSNVTSCGASSAARKRLASGRVMAPD